MFLFNKEDVYIGYSMFELAKVRGVLQKENIKYTYKIINMLGATKEKFGSYGMNMDYEKQCIVSVKKSDGENAKYFVNSVLHP